MPLRVILVVVVALASGAYGQSAATRPSSAPATTLPAIPTVDYPLPAILTPAAGARLQAERIVFEQELFNNAKYDQDDVKRVCAESFAGAADTVQDNLRRFANALSFFEPQFAKGWDLYQKKQWADAAEGFRPLMMEKVGIKQHFQHNTMSPYCYTMTKFLWSECVAQQGQMVEAIVGYQICFEKLPMNFTFSAPARMRVALLYEQTERPHWSLPIYKEVLTHYGAMLTDMENLRLGAKVTALAEIDPYRQAVRKAYQALHRLSRAESTRVTQANQRDLIALMQDMQKMNEEEQRPFLESTQVIVWGAQSGRLEEGTSGTIMLVGEDAPKVGSDDWGQLKPREKQQLIEAFRQMYPQRYTQMLEAYYRNLAAAEANGANGGNGANPNRKGSP
jgi:hypothetical protein